MTTMTIEYDCGYTTSRATTLRNDQTLIANAALGDTLINQADVEHDALCRMCTE